ncbi:formate dehydrogenase formation protein FdhD [Cupriavidus necator N-1]|uniref:Sulfur carrier protein FdhD n=1 Tax=Cupriavidus necator (strain ATCC 43291 / DSM 13513 / CCUG 52238 / LMG 8453 / N-1) TaxID=1042878 RepID=F8GT47_CUPNN|nr:formate dehydrogenase accessory sulfurtransferase FdhD [Cupriavidus necator]AEI79885.1 formate dehydrogenase formation protein FdhD [Cupriavidus necator N-1]KAI3599487.1 Sulfur carrier protein FdhD [Cupriavidus necator H850]MDX6010481.1 formate dehydrogenase accessory sulfurtransferase FdhD [Cupriavidus necator]
MRRDLPVEGSSAGMEEVPAQRTVEVRRWRHGTVRSEDDRLAEETPVALEYNGISHAVMLATPADFDDFAIGFSLSEGIVDNACEIYGIDVEAGGNGVTVKIEIASAAFARLKTRRRALAGRTGCGLCGTESLEDVMRLPQPVQSTAIFDPSVFDAAFAALHNRQTLLRDTGATHAAGWLRADGTLVLVREDVGRHNALDKLAGALASGTEDIKSGAVIVTSRASYEMVLKTASIGAGILAAVSGPTALAVRMAESTVVTLAGFVRSGSLVVYSHPERLRIA